MQDQVSLIISIGIKEAYISDKQNDASRSLIMSWLIKSCSGSPIILSKWKMKKCDQQASLKKSIKSWLDS